LSSGTPYCDLDVAVEVRQCPLGSGARGGGPAVPLGSGARGGGPVVPSGIWTARRRRVRRRRKIALIKSKNLYLTGGEIYNIK